ncbi:RNA-directed DNA polymerase [Paramuricea clavata]|uniref:RNA-directed DNA polymerase, partial n=1 Tax=Paramuricea clavata TaxID=317549 RepID=A0A7D9HWU9_PARCT|nr:RNA-directed DNA polymerase [Paramuricea clavata]
MPSSAEINAVNKDNSSPNDQRSQKPEPKQKKLLSTSEQVPTRKCFRCGLTWPHKDQPSPAEGQQCNNCKNSTPLQVLGQFQCTVESSHKITTAKVFVVKNTTGCLLSGHTAIELDLIHVKANGVTTLNSKKIPTRLKLKNFKVLLHIDPSVKPVVQPTRRIPFAIRNRVEVELKHSEDSDIIEPTAGPAQWKIITDNGPPFISYEIQKFMNDNKIHRHKITPLWPQGNAEAENFMKPLKKCIQAAHVDHKNWGKEMYQFLLN